MQAVSYLAEHSVHVFEGAYPYHGVRIVPPRRGHASRRSMATSSSLQTSGPLVVGVDHRYVRRKIDAGFRGQLRSQILPVDDPASRSREFGVDRSA